MTAADISPAPPTPATSNRRKWRQFSLRTLLLAMLAISVPLAVFAMRLQRARRQASAIATIRALRGEVCYDFQCDLHTSPRNSLHFMAGTSSSAPPWLLAWLGPDFFHDISFIEMLHPPEPGEPPRLWAAIECFPRLVEVRMEGWRDAAAPAALRSQTSLRYLTLERAELDDQDLASLSALENLILLRLGENAFGDSGAMCLGNFPKLKDLSLRNTRVGDRGAAAIAANGTLEWLDMQGTRVGDRGAADLAKLAALERLALNHTRITDVGLAHFRSLQELRWLQLSDNRISDGGLVHLAALTRLTVLDVSRTDVSGHAFARFLPASELSHLAMDGCPVSNVGAASAARLPGLKRLLLRRPGPGLTSLAHVEWSPSLVEIDLLGAPLTDDALLRLAACPNLRSVCVRDTQVSKAGIARFQQVRPEVRVH